MLPTIMIECYGQDRRTYWTKSTPPYGKGDVLSLKSGRFLVDSISPIESRWIIALIRCK